MTPQDYAKAALDDCQLTIRALDVKCGAVLVLLLAPLTSLGKIFAAIEAIPVRWQAVVAGFVFFLLWGLALVSLLRALAPLGNPAKHVPDIGTVKGSYYCGGLYGFKFFDALFRRSVIVANRRVADVAADLPQTASDMLSELAFELMKVCYIRDVKLRLLSWGMRFAEGWLLCGMTIYLVARYGR